MRYPIVAVSIYVLAIFLVGACQSGITPVSNTPGPQAVFSYIAQDQLDLTEKQTEQVEIYQSDPTATEIDIAQVQMDLLRNADGTNAFDLNLPDGSSVSLENVKVEERTPLDYTWYGVGANGQATLVVQNSEIVGTINAAAKLYRIRPIGDGLQAVILVNQAAFPEAHPPEDTKLEQEESPQK